MLRGLDSGFRSPPRPVRPPGPTAPLPAHGSAAPRAGSGWGPGRLRGSSRGARFLPEARPRKQSERTEASASRLPAPPPPPRRSRLCGTRGAFPPGCRPAGPRGSWRQARRPRCTPALAAPREAPRDWDGGPAAEPAPLFRTRAPGPRAAPSSRPRCRPASPAAPFGLTGASRGAAGAPTRAAAWRSPYRLPALGLVRKCAGSAEVLIGGSRNFGIKEKPWTSGRSASLRCPPTPAALPTLSAGVCPRQRLRNRSPAPRRAGTLPRLALRCWLRTLGRGLAESATARPQLRCELGGLQGSLYSMAPPILVSWVL